MDLLNNKYILLVAAVIAFLFAAVLVIMIFRMLFGGRLRMPGGRARQARLGIVDAFDLDRQRQLIIVRRDNTEHLIMIGGPNDLVIESEIIRAEARELRRDQAAGIPEGRIPAPPPALEPAQGDRTLSRPVEEPMLPMPMPQSAVGEAPQAPPRPPTFPLPPRRPVQSDQQQRRPAPPQLPDSVSRGEDIPALSGQPPAPAPAPPAPTVAPAPPSPPISAPPQAPPMSPPPPAMAPTGGPAVEMPKRPPFLKPLTPRPPVRPLQRTTPQAPSLAPNPDTPRPAPIPAPPQGTSPAPFTAPPPKPRPGAPVAPPPQAESKDALESLEEEMAKLLGRGS